MKIDWVTNILLISFQNNMKQLLIAIAAVVLVGTAFTDPLHDAASNGDLAGVQAELDKGVDVDEGDDSWPEITPLHYAALQGQKEIVELLIDNSADVNAKAYNGETPLDWSIGNHHAETAELLRKHGGKTRAELKAAGN